MVNYALPKNALLPEAADVLARQVAEQRRYLDALRRQGETIAWKIAWREARLAVLLDAAQRAENVRKRGE